MFESWLAAGAERLEAAALTAEKSCELTIGMFAALEGAFVLARATRDTRPLKIASELRAGAVERALQAA